MKISIDKEGIIIDIGNIQGKELLSPKQVYALIHELQTALFDWSKLTYGGVGDITKRR